MGSDTFTLYVSTLPITTLLELEGCAELEEPPGVTALEELLTAGVPEELLDVGVGLSLISGQA